MAFEAAALLDSAADLYADHQVLMAVGNLHYSKFVAEKDWDELQAACVYFAPLLDRHARLIPKPIRRFLAKVRRERGNSALNDTDADLALWQTLKARSPADGSWAELLWQLGQHLYSRYQQTGQAETLTEATAILRHAVAASPAGDARRSQRIFSLGSMLQECAQRFQDATLLDASIAAHRQAIRDVGNHPEVLFNLGSALFSFYELTGERWVLIDSLAADRRAVLQTPKSDPRRARRLTNLAITLLADYQDKGQADIHEALAITREACAASAHGDTDLPFMLSALGSALHGLYQQTGDLDALTEAINTHRQAVEEDPNPRHLANLGSALVAHHHRTRKPASLNEAITRLQAAKELQTRPGSTTPPEQVAVVLNSLSIALHTRYRLTQNPTDLAESIAHARQAMSYPLSPSIQRRLRSALSSALISRHRLETTLFGDGEKSSASLDEALENLRGAATTASVDDPHLAEMLSNLGNTLLLKSAETGSPKQAAQAAEVFRRASGITTAPPRIRAEASIAWGRLAAEHERWDEAVEALTTAINMLEQAVPRGLRRDDREHQLKRLRGLASDAAACALRADDTQAAAVLFEQGRGVLLARRWMLALTSPPSIVKILSRSSMNCATRSR